jgi:hypothetical protein
VVASDDGTPKRKRSRRGSRGGRKRKKATVDSPDGSSENESEVAEAAAEDGEPEYVPMSEWIDDFEASRRR